MDEVIELAKVKGLDYKIEGALKTENHVVLVAGKTIRDLVQEYIYLFNEFLKLEYDEDYEKARDKLMEVME
jgi:hypothetical protein